MQSSSLAFIEDLVHPPLSVTFGLANLDFVHIDVNHAYLVGLVLQLFVLLSETSHVPFGAALRR